MSVAQTQSTTPGLTEPEPLAAWANTQAREPAADRPVVLTIKKLPSKAVALDDKAHVEATLTNTSDHDINQIIVRAEATAKLQNPADARTSLVDTSSIYNHTTAFTSEIDKLAPQESRNVTIDVPVGEPSPTGLGITEPGVYGFAINANGQVATEAAQTFLADARTLLSVDPADRPNAAEVSDGTSAEQPSGMGPPPPSAFTMLWPLSADVNVVPGETGTAPKSPDLILKDNSLAAQFADGGRLRGLVDSMASAAKEVQDSTCLAVDPVLAVTADRMASGYLTATNRPSPVPQTVRLRDSWGKNPNEVDSTPGTGAEAAKQWLEDLRNLSKKMCVVPLPAQSANLDALATIDDPSLSLTALASGAEKLDQVLQISSQRNIVIPAKGTIAAQNTPVLQYAGTRLNSDSNALPQGAEDFDGTLESIVEGQPLGKFSDVSVLLADSTLDNPSGKVSETTTALGFQAPLGAALAATGELPETASYSPLVSRSILSDDSPVARMSSATGVLRLTTADAAANNRRIIAVPPATWTADRSDLDSWLAAVDSLLAKKQIAPVPLPQVFADEAKSAQPATIAASDNDPNPLTADSIARAKRLAQEQLKLSSIMVNVPEITLTRTAFVSPMRTDVLGAISDRDRRVYEKHIEANNSSISIIQDSETELQQVTDSVRLLPPGSVYTRASKSTPLMIVASNGLPLPVRGQLQVSAEGAESTAIDSPQLVPARGSIPLALPADEVPNVASGEFTVTLVTPDKVPISAPVNMTTRSANDLLWLVGVIVVLLVAMAWGLARNITRARQSQQQSPSNRGTAAGQ